MIAGTSSGCGKTTISCALLAALSSMGKDLVSFKCGPDYIDPMFHKKTSGVESRNLDVFLMGEQAVKYCLAHHSEGREIAVLEGVMGLYDGLGSGSYASSNHVSLLTNTPVILAVNAKGASLSLCAIIKGFMEFETNNIRGVILNNVSESLYLFYKAMIEERLNIRVIGFMPHIPEAQIESRHLGLITADEITDIKEKLHALGECAIKSIDMEALLDIASGAGPLDCEAFYLPVLKNDNTVKLYIAHDKAFSFWYEDNHDLFTALGAEIRFFSPIRDNSLPDDADGLVLWGGYPEIYAKELEANIDMRRSLKSAIESRLPVYAECGGFMYLQQRLTVYSAEIRQDRGSPPDLQGDTYEMIGVLPGSIKMTQKLQNFGYYEIKAQKDNLMCKEGDTINAHFFHHSVSDNEGDCFNAVKQNSNSFPCIVSEGNIFAGYQHLHFWGNPDFAVNFINECVRYRREAK
jgi:cobyrinic acid a,c-diamide synthase